jgi:hypothetical protein
MRNDQLSSNHWLELRLIGQLSNRSAIGARVILYAAGARQVREISGGSGYLSQNELPIHFGLGAHAIADSIVIAWPSGLVERRFAVLGNRRLNITELETTAVDEPPSLTTLPLTFAAPSPNPARDRMDLSFTLPRAARARLRVIDLDGREVARVLEAEQTSGPHTVHWDGRDTLGQRVGAGVYIVRFEALGVIRTHKVVLMR